VTRLCHKCHEPLPDGRRDHWCLRCRRKYKANYERRVESGEHQPTSRRSTERQMAQLDAARHALIEAEVRTGCVAVAPPIGDHCPRCGYPLHREDGDLDCARCGYRW
jgi:predicted amidophosphoribosyltransferase